MCRITRSSYISSHIDEVQVAIYLTKKDGIDKLRKKFSMYGTDADFVVIRK